MQIYNPKNEQVQVPLTGSQKLTVPAKEMSEVFLGNEEFLSLLVTSFDYGEIYVIPSGPREVEFCSRVSCVPGLIAYSKEEAEKDYQERQEKAEKEKK